MIGTLCLLWMLAGSPSVQDGGELLQEAEGLLRANRPAEALERYDQGLVRARDAGDHALQFDHQHGRANALLRLGRVREAREAMAGMERLGQELAAPTVADDLLRVGSILHLSLGDTERAREDLAALAVRLQARGLELTPRDRVNLALAQLRLGEVQAAQQELRQVFGAIGRTRRGDALDDLRVHALLLSGDVSVAAEDLDGARETYQEGAALAQELLRLPRWIESQVRLAELELRQGRRESLARRVPELRQLAVDIGTGSGLGKAPLFLLCLELAPLVQMLGPDQAREHMERIRTLLGDPTVSGDPSVADRIPEAWNTLAVHHILMGDLAQAQTCLARLLAVLPPRGAEHQRALTLAHQGVVQVQLGQWTRACALLSEARTLAESCEDRAALGLALHNLGALRLREQRWPEALALFEQAEATLPVPTKGMDPFARRAWWDVRIARGDVLHRSGRYEEARSLLTGLLPLLQEPSARYWRSRCLGRLAELESTAGHQDAAREHATRAVAVFRSLGAAEEELELLDELAAAALADGRTEEVRELSEQALRLLRRPALQPLDPFVRANRRSHFAAWAELVQELTMVELAAAEPRRAPAILEAGLGRAADWKAQALAERMGVAAAPLREQARKHQTLARWSEAVQDAELSGGGPWSPAVDEILADDMAAADRALDRLSVTEHVLRPWIRDWRVPDLLRFTESRDVLVLEFAETRDRLLAYVVVRGRVALVDLGERDELWELLDGFRERVVAKASLARFLATGDRVYRRILEPVLSEVGAEVPPTWWLVPTVELFPVPWVAVPMPRGPDPVPARGFHELEYLGDRFEVGIAPSSASLTAWGRMPPPGGTDRALLLGAPGVPEHVVTAGPPAAGCPCGGHADLRGQRPAPPLVHARKELLSVADGLVRQRVQDQGERLRLLGQPREEPGRNLFLEEPYALVMGPEAKARWLEDAGEFGLLHLVAHGSGGGFRDTGLWLAPDEDGQELLTPEQVFHLELTARLVVLSGCETGLGDPLGGEGIQSLAWAFLCAGARGVVASQWSVDDERSALLMGYFYDALLAQGHHPVRALALAQRRLARQAGTLRGPDVRISGTDGANHSNEAAHPFFWAGFQYQGDPGR